MKSSHSPVLKWAVLKWAMVVAIASAVAFAGNHPRKQTIAPHEMPGGDAPGGINSEPPSLPKSPIEFESAEEKRLKAVVIAKGLHQPWSMVFLPDDTILITERSGNIRIVRKNRLLATPVSGVPIVQTGGPRGLQGLMDIALHPDFDNNKQIYFAYHKPTNEGEGQTVLARAVWNGAALVDVQDIFESGATQTEASRIAFGADGMIYMSISAPGSEKVRRSQDMNDYAGKTVRLREDGTIPDDNPFYGRPGTKPAIFTSGHRNGHGLAVNPETKELWETEQGPNGGDELNILRPGRNYGWPLVSYGRDYWGKRISEHSFLSGFEDPIVVWLPSIAVTGMTFYTGDRFPHWKRNLFVGGLREGGIPGTGQIQRIVFNQRWEELRREPLLMELRQRIRDIRQGPDGLLYVLTAEEDGALLRIEPR
jgi:glucose/arabinose dehydrogenase